ncbi:6777_t:CDS:2 [Funneliformis mosseae]|uniref:6777_t:CDS:1 n=1 Tax=Funneliformis mosseae TaxID=27381 RepID=A0A9N9BF75_FUNMO|nr:6777_t:CDS:2 [Funneliformis mosseae]
MVGIFSHGFEVFTSDVGFKIVDDCNTNVIAMELNVVSFTQKHIFLQSDLLDHQRVAYLLPGSTFNLLPGNVFGLIPDR